MSEELNIEVDKNNNVIGLRPRSDFYTGKYIHRGSHLLLFNSNNEILLQKRSSTKKWYPNLYTSSVSATVGDESYEECINREMQEEIGIKIPVKKLFICPCFEKLDKGFHAVFIGRTDDEIKPDTKEIQKIKWIHVENLKKDIAEKPYKYTPTFLEAMKIFFKKHYKRIEK